MPAPAVSQSGRFAHAGVLALTVLVFAVVVAVVTMRLRGDLRQQILAKAAERLTAVATMQLDVYTEQSGRPVEDYPDDMYFAILTVTKLPGVSGMRMYSRDRQSLGAWMVEGEKAPVAAAWDKVMAGESIGRLHDRPAEDLALLAPGASVVESWIPLRRRGSDRILGAAQFWIEGSEVGLELGEHDRRLWTQAAVAWAIGSVVLVLGVGWALRRLEVANRQLRARTEDLQRANRELVLAAKTSALGAVTAHLMHELKTPIAGLEMIVAGQTEAGESRTESGGELAAASELTRRLRTMVNDVVGVLRDEQAGAEFELTAAEVLEVAASKVAQDAKVRGVTVQVKGATAFTLSGRRGNLAILVLRNLLQNALEATPRAGTVTLSSRGHDGGGVEFAVADTGGGLPENVRARLFQPCASSKAGGSGLGLALSYQIAQQAGGRLELVRSDERGTCFRLVLAPEA